MHLLLTIDDVAAALRVSRRTAYQMRARADFPRPIVLSARVVRYEAEQVRAFVASIQAQQHARREPAQLAESRAQRQAAWPQPRGTAGGPAAGAGRDAVAERALAEPDSDEPGGGQP